MQAQQQQKQKDYKEKAERKNAHNAGAFIVVFMHTLLFVAADVHNAILI